MPTLSEYALDFRISSVEEFVFVLRPSIGECRKLDVGEALDAVDCRGLWTALWKSSVGLELETFG